jgi:predicted enzyme related to lactoylglutathione lyase
MKKQVLLIIGFVASFCIGLAVQPIITKHNNDVKIKKVTGIGGIFFKCKDPHKVKEWYKTHLGFNTDQYGMRFVWQEGADSTKKASLQWATFSDSTKYFAPSTKDFMINYRVDNLVELVEQLKKEGVTFVDEMEVYDGYGKFVHIMDIEGNKIELYEPIYK